MGGLPGRQSPWGGQGITNITLMGMCPHPPGTRHPLAGGLGVVPESPAGQAQGGSPFTTSDTLQLGSMLPMCLGWAGLVLPSKMRAVGGSEGVASWA